MLSPRLSRSCPTPDWARTLRYCPSEWFWAFPLGSSEPTGDRYERPGFYAGPEHKQLRLHAPGSAGHRISPQAGIPAVLRWHLAGNAGGGCAAAGNLRIDGADSGETRTRRSRGDDREKRSDAGAERSNRRRAELRGPVGPQRGRFAESRNRLRPGQTEISLVVPVCRESRPEDRQGGRQDEGQPAGRAGKKDQHRSNHILGTRRQVRGERSEQVDQRLCRKARGGEPAAGPVEVF